MLQAVSCLYNSRFHSKIVLAIVCFFYIHFVFKYYKIYVVAGPDNICCGFFTIPPEMGIDVIQPLSLVKSYRVTVLTAEICEVTALKPYIPLGRSIHTWYEYRPLGRSTYDSIGVHTTW